MISTNDLLNLRRDFNAAVDALDLYGASDAPFYRDFKEARRSNDILSRQLEESRKAGDALGQRVGEVTATNEVLILDRVRNLRCNDILSRQLEESKRLVAHLTGLNHELGDKSDEVDRLNARVEGLVAEAKRLASDNLRLTAIVERAGL